MAHARCRRPETTARSSASRFPFQEVRDQPQAQALALFRVELGADHGVTANDGGDRTARVRLGDETGALGRLEMIRVYEIGVQSVRADIDTVEQRMRPLCIERVPAHMRDLQARVR